MVLTVNPDIILWGAAFGLLLGIIWSLKYVVVIDRRIVKLERRIEDLIYKMEARDELIIKRTAPTILKELKPAKTAKRTITKLTKKTK